MLVSTIDDIRHQLGYYGIPFLLISGNLGNFFVVLMLGRCLKKHANSCSLYLLFASLANWLLIDTVLISTFYGMKYLEPIHSSAAICKLRWYGGHVLFMFSRCCSKIDTIFTIGTMITLLVVIAACIDRWALCSGNVRIRSFCQPHIARRVIIVSLSISTVLPIQLFIFFDNDTGHCRLSAFYSLAYTIFALIAIGLVPLLLIILFSVLVRHNLQLIRSRVMSSDGAMRPIRIHKRDHDLMKMLAGEVLIYCITTVPYPINLIYSYFNGLFLVDKSAMRLAIEALISFLIHPLLSFTYCCTQFYGMSNTTPF